MGATLAITAAVLLILAVLMTLQVLTQIRAFNSAGSDNVQWTLSQVEIESIRLTNSLDQAQRIPSGPSSAALEQVRLNFDVFYSRVSTFTESSIYRQLTQNPDFSAALQHTLGFLDTSVALIDSPDIVLNANLARLHKNSLAIQPSIRQMSLSGLAYFVTLSDTARIGMTKTLIQLAGLAALLVAALVGLVFLLLSVYRQTKSRGLALAQANQRMNTILTTSLDAVIVTDDVGRVLEFNEAAEAVFLCSRTEILGHYVADLIVPDHLRETDPERLRGLGIKGIHDVIGSGRMPVQAKRADGLVFPAEISLQAAMDGQQELYIAFLHDISKRVADEIELVTARDRALAGEKAKSDFLTVMSHEIRTPLNGLLGSLSLMEGTGLSDAQKQLVRNMEVSGDVLIRHVDSVLDIARFGSVKLEYDHENVKLSEILQGIMDGQAAQAKQQGTSLSWHWIGPQRDDVQTNRLALEQILLNLVGNAIKFTPKGRVTIEVEALPELIDDLPVIEFRVTDTGTGIPQASQEQIFEDFVTHKPTSGSDIGGTGLGLGIARRSAHSLGGEVGVESTEGEGSVFWLRLPMADAAQTIDLKPHQISGKPPMPLKILLVEDNEINSAVAVEMLVRDGHVVDTAANGRAGVEAARQTCYDVILMDIAMPVMDGLQATRLIRQGTGPSHTTPIIAVSANILPDDKERFLQAGMDAFVAKPINPTDIRNALLLRDTKTLNGDAPPQQNPNVIVDYERLSNNCDAMGRDAFIQLRDRYISEVNTLLTDHPDTKLAAKSLQSLSELCHKAAGSSAVFGATRLRAALLELAQQARSGALPQVQSTLRRLKDLWPLTRDALLNDQQPKQARKGLPHGIDGGQGDGISLN